MERVQRFQGLDAGNARLRICVTKGLRQGRLNPSPLSGVLTDMIDIVIATRQGS